MKIQIWTAAGIYQLFTHHYHVFEYYRADEYIAVAEIALAARCGVSRIIVAFLNTAADEYLPWLKSLLMRAAASVAGLDVLGSLCCRLVSFVRLLIDFSVWSHAIRLFPEMYTTIGTCSTVTSDRSSYLCTRHFLCNGVA